MFRRWLHDTLTRLHPKQPFDILVPPDANMGDYSVNLAMVLAKDEKKNPKEIAQAMCDELMKEGAEMLEKCEIAGPGFVNVFLKDAYLQAQLGESDIPNIGHQKKVIVEYSSPNIAKPMHVGHLRSTVIGDALANVYKALGYDVIRWNYISDWGTQFGKLIVAYKRWKNEAAFEKDPIQEMLRIYVKFHNELEKNPELDREARQEFKKLEEGDAENRRIWRLFREKSLEEFNAMYRQLDIGLVTQGDIVMKGEGDYEHLLQPLIEKLVKKGITQESDGALIVNLESEKLPPALIRKSDGATLYLTRDIASLQDRIATYAPAEILYVIGNEQTLHLQQLFAIAQRIRLHSTKLVHVKFGMVLGEDGKKLATREGKVVPLQEVIDKLTALVAERNPETAHAVAIGALKYNDLRQNPHSDIVFDWKAMLDLGGNSGPYLQYTYARLAGILRNNDEALRFDEGLNYAEFILQKLTPPERALMRHMLDFGYTVQQCASDYALNGLALYLYELAEKANRFYETVRVSEEPDAARKTALLHLVRAVSAQLKRGLELLGIEALERV